MYLMKLGIRKIGRCRMREIKFRAWDKHKKKMIDNVNVRRIPLGYLEDETCTGGAYADELYEFMQYIGLKDKNGKEIYEGDILHGEFYGYPIDCIETFTVKWHKADAGFLANYFNNAKCEVIGNIFDNPELLERGVE